MPSLKISDKLEFSYTDSGIPQEFCALEGYRTIIFIHGYLYHSGVFRKVSALGPSRGTRVLSINRRAYPGSTPYTTDALAIFASGTSEARARALHAEGVHLAEFVGKLMHELGLVEKSVSIVGWSLGCTYLLALMGALADPKLTISTRKTLQRHTDSIVFLEPPSGMIGFQDPPCGWMPLADASIPEEQRNIAFARWVSGYYSHPNLAGRHACELNTREPIPSKPPTIEHMTADDFLAVMDLGGEGPAGDLALGDPAYLPVFRDLLDCTLLNPAVRKAWGNPRVSHLYGDQTTWNIVNGAWCVEDEVERLGDPLLHVDFKVIKGANHFIIWDDPEVALDQLKGCVASVELAVSTPIAR